jgi:hypothetical protein
MLSAPPSSDKWEGDEVEEGLSFGCVRAAWDMSTHTRIYVAIFSGKKKKVAQPSNSSWIVLCGE